MQVLFDDPEDIGNQVLSQAAGDNYLPENWARPFATGDSQPPRLADPR
ncbi:hypothetical protein [Leifsonia aquatica]|nr:hypothetical protein [Leifsonia aquatica]